MHKRPDYKTLIILLSMIVIACAISYGIYLKNKPTIVEMSEIEIAYNRKILGEAMSYFGFTKIHFRGDMNNANNYYFFYQGKRIGLMKFYYKKTGKQN